MIIGAILETSWSSTGAQSQVQNGASILHFYNMQDAETWARIQSEYVAYGTNPEGILTLCTVINTDTELKRWWFNGIEYTG